MGVPDELFDESYLYFYEEALDGPRADAEADLLTRLIPEGARILDVPCGHGRIAGRLAARGYDVVGIDRSELFLTRARERWPGLDVRHGDMRALPFAGEFDAVVNWFTSFGYFDRVTNDAVLAGFARALRPGGRLILEVHNPGRLAALVALAGGSSVALTDRGDDLMVDRARYDPAEGFSHTERLIVRDGRVRRLEFTLEQVPAPQLTERLRAAGFARVELLGQGGGAFDPEGPRLIAVATR